ncbi:MAG: type II toxin-antitoxin system mRNA interferase toxin, RelE/StbE family [Candidatus Nealsonbacteria bacterium CG08_land_8_20_14_0_20_38_20]|uniref:Type II toxin-antitoxin system mRNA interferase toxin, RelE/StbE family n=1 Tax=Candidatus Nealsonbacteria bacterium CG08_land_8_20_14_0_20_38_20 TaxID=1974705 RepID=A0A2H0YN79_9BACT|nr:MAG: type II toxin-antitoxin system mRNA interferase toxin, RelE/StbE family [Candidatus Nealsonbacteria bacterium CG08_land_8_20_14_0_20_38_20]
MIKIYPTSRFKKSYKKLSLTIKKKTEKREKVFISNPFHASLKTHKLKGRLKNFWAYSVDENYRILFRFISKHKVIYFDIGTHKIYE